MKYLNKDLIKNFIPLKSNTHRLSLLLKNSLLAIQDPTNANAVSNVGDLASMNSLYYIKNKMLSNEAGRKILEEKPRMRNDQFDFNKLKDYPNSSFGKHYYNFMSKYDFKPEERPLCQYYTDIELAYIIQRYREIHDFVHVLMGYDILVIDEVAVKIFESLHLKLPSAAISGLFAPIKLLSIEELGKLFTIYIPHVKMNAENSTFILNVYFENELEKDIVDVRKELGIVCLEEFKQKF